MSDEEEDICRVCRTSASPERPLQYPCRCSGSIRYIHQDCLLMWLSHSKAKSCELCGHKFQWTPIYAANAPARLPLHEVLQGLFARARAGMPNVVRVISVIMCWFILVPLHTTYFFYLFFGRSSMSPSPSLSLRVPVSVPLLLSGPRSFHLVLPLPYLNPSTYSLSSFGADLALGVFLTLSITLLAVGLVSLFEYLLSMYPVVAGLIDRDLPDAPAPQRDDVPANDDPLVGQDPVQEPPIRDDVIPAVVPLPAQALQGPQEGFLRDEWDFEEFVGLQGPIDIIRLLVRVMWVVLFNAGFMLLFALVPISLGRAVNLLWKTYVFPWESQHHSSPIYALFVGYASISVFVMIWYAVSYGLTNLLKRSRNPVYRLLRQILSFTYVFGKVSTILCCELVFFPIVIGWWLDVCTVDMFAATVQGRAGFYFQHPFMSTVLHWAVGLGYMFHFASYVQWVRDVVRPGVLWFLRDPTDPFFNPLKEMIELSFFRHARRLFLSLAIYSIVVVLLIWLPIKVMVLYMPHVLPFNIAVRGPLYEGAIDLLMHVFAPYAAEHCHPKANFKRLLRAWFDIVGRLLSMTDYLLPAPTPENDQDPEAPPRAVTYPRYFALRVIALLNIAWVSMALFNSLSIVLPTYVGRTLLSWLDTRGNDVYALYVGFIVIYFVVHVLHQTIGFLRGATVPAVVSSLGQWSVVGAKTLFVSVFALGIIPLMLGVFVELLFIVPGRVGVTSTGTLHIWQDWAIGFVYMNILHRFFLLWNELERARDDIERAQVAPAPPQPRHGPVADAHDREDEDEEEEDLQEEHEEDEDGNDEEDEEHDRDEQVHNDESEDEDGENEDMQPPAGGVGVAGGDPVHPHPRHLHADPLGSWPGRLQRIQDDGFRNMNVTRIMGEVIIPVTSVLAFFLSLPYVTGRLVVPAFGGSVVLAETIFRFGYLGMVAIVISYYMQQWVVLWVRRLHNTIRDDKYLIGRQLHNIDEAQRQTQLSPPRLPNQAPLA
eukprot:TRINITY_DN11733_c0_g1_i6.p1 TRINITY_DN11733_c0_g1~~TRINITY_DN11733_c0_g1_i6.p1  ORF type:complete len:992 (+),score=148.42 TRINITY_DN11733_c0_g1_i6:50-3025(+)